MRERQQLDDSINSLRDLESRLDDNLGLIELGEEEGVEYDEEGYKASNEVLKNQVKSWIARNLWDVNASYQSFVDSDDALQEAIKILKDGSLFIELKINR